MICLGVQFFPRVPLVLSSMVQESFGGGPTCQLPAVDGDLDRVSFRGAEVGDIRGGLCVVGVIDDAMVLD